MFILHDMTQTSVWLNDRHIICFYKAKKKMAVEIRKLSTVLFFVACAIFVPQESGGILLDPTLIGRELQSFANDALGVDDLQVRLLHVC